MSLSQTPAKHRILIAASTLCLVMGSIHAFSVFLEPLEAMHSASRGQVSLTYSFALISITLSVLFGPRIFGAAYAHWIFLAAGLVGGFGALIAAFAPSLPVVWIGYSLTFGLANGLAYGYGLQISAQVWPGREGFAMGVVTAAYALGAVLAPRVFEAGLAWGGFQMAMLILLAAQFVAAVISIALTRPCNVLFNPAATDTASQSNLTSTLLLWLAYFGGVLAGLMVIGHATGVAQQWDPAAAPWLAPAVIAACNMVGCLATGRMTDQVSPPVLLAGLALGTSVVLILLGLDASPFGVLASLGIIGFCYGGTISAYPAAITKQFGPQSGAKIFGQVFTAWGAAGLVGPWLAGRMFDVSGSYDTAILVASSAGALSLCALITVYRPGLSRR